MPYSREFRGEVLAACDAGEGTQAVALRFQVSESWVRRVKQQRRETGQIAAKTTRNRTPIWQAWADWLLAKVAERPDVYLRELQAELKLERGESVCLQTICNACRALEQTRKKRRLSLRSKIGQMSSNNEFSGTLHSQALTQIVLSSSMKHGPRRI